MRSARDNRSQILKYACLAVLAIILAAACRGKKEEPAGGAAAGPITLDEVKSVLGTANDFASGVVDVTQGNDELIIAYRYYDADLENYETDFASEMAPRIQALYKRFKTLDRLHLQVTSNTGTTPNLWQPFTEFVLDRKTVEEIHWTGFLARYLLDLVIKNKRS